jgi:hypothetical protein
MAQSKPQRTSTSHISGTKQACGRFEMGDLSLPDCRAGEEVSLAADRS